MAVFIKRFSCFCCFRKKTHTQESHDLSNKESHDLNNKESDDLKSPNPDSDEDNSDDLPLPPARDAVLKGTYSCKNMVLENSRSIKKKLSGSLNKIQMPRASSMVLKRDGEEKKKKLKAENSILVRPIILGEKCRVLDDEDEEPRMPKNRIYRPRSMSSISLSLANTKIDDNVIQDTETSREIQ